MQKILMIDDNESQAIINKLKIIFENDIEKVKEAFCKLGKRSFTFTLSPGAYIDRTRFNLRGEARRIKKLRSYQGDRIHNKCVSSQKRHYHPNQD